MQKLAVNDTVTVKGAGASPTLWVIEMIAEDGFACIIRQHSESGTRYAPQRFDTSLLQKAKVNHAAR